MKRIEADSYKKNEALIAKYMENNKISLKCFDNLIDRFKGRVDAVISSGDVKPNKQYCDGIYNILMKKNLCTNKNSVSFGRSVFEVNGNFGCTIPNKLINTCNRSEVMDYLSYGTLRYYGDDIFYVDCYNKEQKIELNDITSVGYYISAHFDLKGYLMEVFSSISNVTSAIIYMLNNSEYTVKRIMGGINIGVLFGIENQIMPLNFSIPYISVGDWANGLKLVDGVLFASDEEFVGITLSNLLNVDNLYESYCNVIKEISLNKDETNDLISKMTTMNGNRSLIL